MVKIHRGHPGFTRTETVLSPRLKFSASPGRIAAHVQDRANSDVSSADQIVDRKWERLSEEAEEPKVFRMDYGVEGQRFRVSQHRVDKGAADTRLLLVVEVPSLPEIEFDFLQIDNLHDSALESLLQFAAGEIFRLAPFNPGAAFREDPAVPLRRIRFGDPQQIPEDFHALEAFLHREFS